jgi:hypothetical protein
MGRNKNSRTLEERVTRAAEAALAARKYVSPIDVLLGAGDAKLTRRAKARSARHAVVVRFSKARKRYERQGLLVEPQALREAEAERT